MTAKVLPLDHGDATNMTLRTSITVDSSIRIPMRDGVTLHADLYLPEHGGPLPVLLCRTPYNRETVGFFATRAARNGYAVLVQDVRGRWGSEGEWIPFVCEQPDGFDTCAWILDQPWSNGRIGMFGGSYVGATQWQAAIAQSPGLRAIAPAITGSNYHHGWTYQGGAFELGFNLSWTLGLAQNTATRIKGADLEAVYDAHDQIDRAFARMPLKGDPLLAKVAPYYDEWLAHPTYDNFWKTLAPEEHYGELDIACFHIGGWYDIFLGGTVRNYVGMRNGAKTNWARENQYLTINPRDHYTYGSNAALGNYDPGIRSVNGTIDLDGRQIAFFDRALKDESIEQSRVSIFVMGDDYWRSESEWPLARAVPTDYFLHSGGKANTRDGQGTLTLDPPISPEPGDSYLYDPRNPAPTVGGPLCGHQSKLIWGRRDQREVEMRPDVLVYSSAELHQPVEVSGNVSVTLFVTTSATDTDFTAKLVDVCPDGTANNVVDGIIRARYRESMESPSLLEPGEAYELTIDLTATNIVFGTGHRIRLEISSSNFPRFDRNPNTGGDIASTDLADCAVAIQTVWHTADHPSRISLPVLAASR